MERLNPGYLTAQMSRTIGVIVAASAAFAAIAPASAAGSAFSPLVVKPSLRLETGGAAAGTHYGGSGVYRGNRTANPMLGLVVRPNGRISARASLAVRCRGHYWTPLYVRLAGTAQGTAIAASGKTRLPAVGYLRISLQGTADGQTASGTLRVRKPHGCAGWTTPFVMHSDSAPAGAPAMPPPRSILTGLTAQAAGGVRLPVSVSVTHTGKIWAQWDATMGCRPGTFPMTNLTPLTKIRPDGTFTRSERYSIRYKGGLVDHYRVTFTGAFRSDGVSGTLTARVRTTKRGSRYRPCASGTQTWAARA